MRMHFALRLLAFFAVLLMPFGMAAAPAQADMPHATAAMAMEHCPGQPPTDDGTSAPEDCTMPCSAALPAAELPAASLHWFERSAAVSTAPQLLTEIELEIATPPPKLS